MQSFLRFVRGFFAQCYEIQIIFKWTYLTNRWNPNRVHLRLQIKADLEIMTMKRYSIFPRSPELESHHQMQFNPILTTTLFFFGGRHLVLPLQRIQSVLPREWRTCLMAQIVIDWLIGWVFGMSTLDILKVFIFKQLHSFK